MEESKPSREELKKRLRSKINGYKKHQPPSMRVTPKEYSKMMDQMKEELKKMNDDERITPKMTELYYKTKSTYNKVEIPSPLELLNNQDLGCQKYGCFFYLF